MFVCSIKISLKQTNISFVGKKRMWAKGIPLKGHETIIMFIYIILLLLLKIFKYTHDLWR